MRALIEKLALGNAVYETPDAQISENRIAVCLEPGSITQGEISICGKNAASVKGVVFSSDNHVIFENNQFYGVNNKVKYTITTKNLDEGQVCSGTISVITTGGDYAIPFAITVKKKELDSTIGKLVSLEDFVKLVQESYDEALILFLSKEFREYFLKQDSFGTQLYRQVMKNSNRSIALEEFLVGMGLKERITIKTSETIREYMDIMENYGDTVNIIRSNWGYVDIDIKIEGDFLYNCKEKITGEDFNGKIAEYQYFINVGRLHGGSNHGRITFTTSNETLIYDIVIVNKKEENKEYIEQKKSDISFVKNYLNFRTGLIDGKTWMAEMDEMADERLEHNENDVVGLLAKAQIAIVQNEEEKAAEYLNTLSKLVAVKDATSIEAYCYYLYLKTLYKNNSSYTDDIKAEIKQYFEGGHDTWQLLWMLFYMDERYDENPSLKYTLIKRMFNNGCFSPVMYYEAANVLNQQPELLRIINKFEIQVLNFAGKYHIATEELAKQAAELLEKEKVYHESYMNILSRLYEDTSCKEVLHCICTMIINGNKMEKEYFRWLKEGVKNELKITNLYEYYIYTIDTTNYEPLEKSAYRYFSYGTDTLVYNRDYFFANLIQNYKPTDSIMKRYRDDMEKYVTSQLLAGNNNAHLRIVYKHVVTDDFIVGDMQGMMPEVLHTYQVKVDNDKIKNIAVTHKEIDYTETVSVKDGIAYVHLYTEHPVLMFVDEKGHYLSETKHQITRMVIDAPIKKTGTSMMTKLCEIEEIISRPDAHQGKILELKEVAENPSLTKQFSLYLKEVIVDYYYKGYDQGDLDIYLLQFDMKELSKASRNKVIEILIERNLIEMAYPYIAKYGYRAIDRKLLEKLCVSLVRHEEYQENEILTEMCGEVFRNGCRDEEVMKFLGRNYESGSLELYQLFLALQAKAVDDNKLAERLLTQYLFEANTEDKIYNIYDEYIKGSTNTKIRKAFYTYVSYNYFIKKVQCPDRVWELMELEFSNGLSLPLICRISFVEVMSKKESLTEQQLKITEMLIEGMAKNNVNFQFYKKFNKWFKVPFELADKTIVDFRTNPKHRLDITYEIKTADGKTKKVTEEMGSLYPGIFTKEVIMFYGEEIDYSITEYSVECPQGKVVDNYSVRISEKNAYNDESRFGMINGIMICKDVGRDDAARDIMKNYELCKRSGRELFKLL